MSFVMRARAPRAPAPASALLQPALQPPPPSPVPGPEWRVLIVDSDPDVHAAFRLALEGHSLFGRPLVFLYARSGTQARNLLRSEQDLAVVVLDAVTDGTGAGLVLVAFIIFRMKKGSKHYEVVAEHNRGILKHLVHTIIK